MTVKDIALSAAALLQADDIEALLRGDSAAADPDVKTLVKSVNAAAAAAAEYFPVCITETPSAEDGVIPFSAFTRRPSAVMGVKRGRSYVSFVLTPDGIAVRRDGSYSVTYSVEPKEAGIDDEVETAETVGIAMMAFLTARNYCLITGRSDEASVWDQMYEAQAAARRLTRRAKLPARVWR